MRVSDSEMEYVVMLCRSVLELPGSYLDKQAGGSSKQELSKFSQQEKSERRRQKNTLQDH